MSAARQHLRPSVRGFPFAVHCRHRRDLSAFRRHSEERALGFRREHDGAVRRPRSTARFLDRGDGRDRPTGEHDLQQAAAREEADVSAVGREERRVGPFGPGESNGVQLVESPEIQLPSATRGAARDEDHGSPIRRQNGGGANPVEARPPCAGQSGVTATIDAETEHRCVRERRARRRPNQATAARAPSASATQGTALRLRRRLATVLS